MSNQFDYSDPNLYVYRAKSEVTALAIIEQQQATLETKRGGQLVRIVILAISACATSFIREKGPKSQSKLLDEMLIPLGKESSKKVKSTILKVWRSEGMPSKSYEIAQDAFRAWERQNCAERGISFGAWLISKHLLKMVRPDDKITWKLVQDALGGAVPKDPVTVMLGTLDKMFEEGSLDYTAVELIASRVGSIKSKMDAMRLAAMVEYDPDKDVEDEVDEFTASTGTGTHG